MDLLWEIFSELRSWGILDTWIAITGALAAMACAVPGCYLLLRKQSMMGDALSHTSLLGITIGFLTAIYLHQSGLVPNGSFVAWKHLLILAGATVVGILAAAMTEWIQKFGSVEASAALGVVFTLMFAAGLLLMRLTADKADIDPDCVLYGSVETAFIGTGVPDAAIVSGVVLLANIVLTVLFYKELRVSAFDPGFATSIGVHSRVFHYALMTVTAATVVTAFESVGAILVIAMLIVPAATAHLLTDRLWLMLVLSVVVAAASAVIGHAGAIALPHPIFSRLGFDSVQTASTAGMMAVAGGLLFFLAALFGPTHGIVVKTMDQVRIAIRVAAEDVLGLLYRYEERLPAGQPNAMSGEKPNLSFQDRFGLGVPRWAKWFAIVSLQWRKDIRKVKATGSRTDDLRWELTDRGRGRAAIIVRSHRLWESYMAKHFRLDEDHLHEAAAIAEHFLTSEMRDAIVDELASPDTDPHGRQIPTESGRRITDVDNANPKDNNDTRSE